jgi:mercuric ion binding protein
MLINKIFALSLLCFGGNALAGTIEMQVNGLVCGFCAQGIEKTLRKNPATADVFVSLETRLVAIATKDGKDIADNELRKALTNSGYDVKGIARTQNSLASLREQAAKAK